MRDVCHYAYNTTIPGTLTCSIIKKVKKNKEYWFHNSK